MKENLVKMKEELLRYMNEAIELFESSKYITGYVYWFKEKEKILTEAEVDSKEFKKTLKEVDNSLVGMGSFDDVVIYPKENSGLSYKEAAKKQVKLVEKIGDTIDKILKTLREEKRQSKLKKR